MMIMWTFLTLLLFLHGITGAPVPSCPKSCSCTSSQTYLEVHCKSFNGLKKSQLSPEQITAIVALDVNGSTTKTNPDLSHLHHLKRLTLSSNKIQEIVVAHLPKSLEHLDLSQNSITHPPQALELLPVLKEVILFGNPISCNCVSLAVRDTLLDRSVTVLKGVKCESPENLRGKQWLTTSCEQNNGDYLFGGMQGDAPYEGSGSGDNELVIDEPKGADHAGDTSLEDEFILDTSSRSPVAVVENEEFEGSGDENETTTELLLIGGKSGSRSKKDDPDYDYDEEEDYDAVDDHSTDAPEVTEPPAVFDQVPYLNSGIKACNFNCSTPSPLIDSNDTDALPPPGIFDGIRMVLEDLGDAGKVETTPAANTTAILVETTTTIIAIPADADKEQEGIVIAKNVTLTEAEIIKDGLNSTDRKENIEQQPKQSSNSTFIFLSVLLLVIICLIIYAIVKKRSVNRNSQLQQSNRLEQNEKVPEEVELIKKVNPETDKPNGTHETIPLMNGHNETQLKTAEEALPKDANGASKQLEEEVYDEEVELRPKKEEHKILLTPEAKRVTIKASEIPNSTPKTPILVTRHVNSDGSIVTTPNIAIDQTV